MKKLMVVASVSLLVAAFAGSPALAACKDDLVKVKAAVAATPENKKSGKDTAAVKIKEAEAALAKKDEAGCMAAVKAADASIK